MSRTNTEFWMPRLGPRSDLRDYDRDEDQRFGFEKQVETETVAYSSKSRQIADLDTRPTLRPEISALDTSTSLLKTNSSQFANNKPKFSVELLNFCVKNSIIFHVMHT